MECLSYGCADGDECCLDADARVPIAQNFSMMSEYMTNMGRIKPRRDTGLRAVNQRKIAKAIRRAVGMGLLPSVHEHPEVLEVKARTTVARLENGLGVRR